LLGHSESSIGGPKMARGPRVGHPWFRALRPGKFDTDMKKSGPVLVIRRRPPVLGLLTLQNATYGLQHILSPPDRDQ